ncbi:GNAT family N-acetyltransferase [Gracilibacillus sp. S3-1-1]|uniref:GNAT family N-acetyltransferase n=1 Tax=Gracilibacillus pellucidus TaxID=3095368 RepID=A0ACC6M6U4_9BACI|nr:GNAT family N-acetyltransferase [Gracilibacillus sp. S3-1-1]MDX8046482.1 GNAT family N-acetyltransferase [Gracilibacillus sp. S3-1-1]
MDLKIEQLQYDDAEKLLAFELENRDFFEEMVPSRGDEYYKVDIFNKQLQNLLDEQVEGLSYYHLIKSKEGTILGRINLVDIDHSQQLGHVGYRVGKAYTGSGIASEALRLLIESMSKQGIRKLLAKTTTNNIASQKILTRNGFEQVTTDTEEFEMNGQTVKFIYFRKSIVTI